jgi:predicted aminopeptidase
MVKRYIKLLGLLLLTLTLFMAACNYRLLKYGISQGYGQLRIVMKAKPVSEVLKDPSFPDSLKSSLLLIQEVRRFAIDSLGVNDSRNYTTVYDQQGKPVLWVITACEPYRFKPKIWSFPFVGEVPYKGFFNRKEAEKERRQLDDDGYDTELGSVGGWSTLGWFRDPILSNMLDDSEGAVAELIIHELTHATIYVKDSTDYNENLASFIGESGARRFLTFKYGPDSPELKHYLDEITDEDRYSRYILSGARRLDSLYKTLGDRPAIEKDSLKKQLIADIRQRISTSSFSDTAYFHRRIRKARLNNAYFMSFKRYEGKQHDFQRLLDREFKGDLRKFLSHMKSRYPSV